MLKKLLKHTLIFIGVLLTSYIGITHPLTGLLYFCACCIPAGYSHLFFGSSVKAAIYSAIFAITLGIIANVVGGNNGDGIIVHSAWGSLTILYAIGYEIQHYKMRKGK